MKKYWYTVESVDIPLQRTESGFAPMTAEKIVAWAFSHNISRSTYEYDYLDWAIREFEDCKCHANSYVEEIDGGYVLRCILMYVSEFDEESQSSKVLMYAARDFDGSWPKRY